jgi:hypothetical protein
VRGSTRADSKLDPDTDTNGDSHPRADTHRDTDANRDTDTNSDSNPDARPHMQSFAGAGATFHPPGRACRGYPAQGRPWFSRRCCVSECGKQHGDRRG